MIEALALERAPEGGTGAALLTILVIVGLLVWFWPGGRKH